MGRWDKRLGACRVKVENNKMECVYQGEGTGKGKHQCFLQDGEDGQDCKDCNHKLLLEDDHFLDKWLDPLIMLDRKRSQTTSLRNLLAGGCAFLVGGGPSTNDIALEKLNYRGIFSLGVNNSAAHPRFRASAFVCSDPPKKFSHSIWLDPHCMKFVPTPKMTGNRQKLRCKKDGVFDRLDKGVSDCPNVWGFKRWSWFSPDENYFLTNGACWGNHNSGVKKTGEKKTVCTMLLGLRLLHYLGAKRIFLVGVDFLMKPGAVYSFNQGKGDGGCTSNNNQFAVVNEWLSRMEDADVFGKFGIEIFNCYEYSGLRAFPYMEFEEAIEAATIEVEQHPDLKSWYEKDCCPKCKSWHIDCNDAEKKICIDCKHTWK